MSICLQDFPSVGDLHSTVPVPREKWFEYGGERSGRFQVWSSPLYLVSAALQCIDLVFSVESVDAVLLDNLF